MLATHRNPLRHNAGNLLHEFMSVPQRLLIVLITLYQKTLSPDHGPLKDLHPYGFCPQKPTCSEYARDVIAGRGAVVGILLALYRLLSCHPWKRPSEHRMYVVLLNHHELSGEAPLSGDAQGRS